ncbi:MAG: hypothetical protein K2H76_02780 [Muribaculaceae bacterium]|nr:hypothetical protein [Muribaculaceae bacterium]
MKFFEKRKNPFFYVSLSAVAMGIAAGCATDECYDNRNALPYAGFYGVMDGKMSSISVDSLRVYGIGAPGDSILSEGKRAIANLYLPFRIDSDTTSYVFKLINKAYDEYEIADTVTFVYSREARFVSSACGASYIYTIKDIRNTGLLIDSISVLDGRITNSDIENIQIYFNTGETPDYSGDENE